MNAESGHEAAGAGLARRWATSLVCSRTGATAPLDAPAFLSPAGAPWLVEYALDPARGEWLRRVLPGRPWTLWRYRELLPLADFERRIDLGEGATPLVRLRRTPCAGAELWVKDEAGNPTGSFKARGLSLAVNRARELGAPGVQLASAGNAALALAAYAAAAGLPARVAMPADTPPSIAARCRDHGAEVLSSPGTLVEAARLLSGGAGGEAFWNLSTLREPYRAEGKKTMGLELAEQLGWELPDWIVYPLGGGTGIVGMHKAFAELRRLGLVGEKRPRFVAVQMAGCAPIVRAFAHGQESAEPWEEPHTRVWGLRVPRALGDFLVLRALRESAGRAVAVDEACLPEVAARAARDEGLRVGPEGAAALAATLGLAAEGAFAAGERVVVFQTGDPANYL
jgi:threonine synthase